MLGHDAAPPLAERLLAAYARRFPVQRGKLRAVNTLWRAAAGAGDHHRLAKLEQGGFLMRCDLEEMLQRQFYFFGTYFLERHLLACWSAFAAGARTVFDVGANAGIYSLAAVAARPGGAVHAFEPTPEIAAGLRETIALNGLDSIQVHQAAVYSRSGHVQLQRLRGETGDNGGMNFVTHDSPGAEAERVVSVTLDEFCDTNGVDRIDLMKLDIQGQEPGALAGAARLLREGRLGVVFLELNWGGADAPCSATECVDILSQAGYRFAEPAPRPEFREAGPWLRAHSDIVARPMSELKDQVR